MWAKWVQWLRALFGRADLERDLDDELRFHFDRYIQRLVEAGCTREEAMRRARLEFGSLEQVKEECRDVRATRWIQDLWQDVRYGVRTLWRGKLSTVAVITTLAVGIGVNAAVFSAVDWVLIRPLPYPTPDELVRVLAGGMEQNAAAGDLTYTEFETLAETPTLTSAAAISMATRILADAPAGASHAVVARVGGDLFGALGLSPVLGRGFTGADAAAGLPLVVVSEALWRRGWGGDPEIIGRMVTLDGQLHTIVGVMPANRGYPREADVWRPLAPLERDDDDREFAVVARLARGITVERAAAEIAARTALRGLPEVRLEPLQGSSVTHVRTALLALLASSGIVLLMACANVAALVSARTAERTAEFRLRRALGAGRPRLLRQIVTETLLLSLGGGAAGLLLGRWALDLLVGLAPAELPRLEEIALDARVLVAGVAISFAAGLVIAAAPLRMITRVESGRGVDPLRSARVSRRVGGRTLVVGAQAALAIALTVGAGLLARSLQHLVSIDHGFVPDRLVAVQLTLRGTAATDSVLLYRTLIAAAEATPGVRSAAAALRLPVHLTSLRIPMHVVDQPHAEPVSAMLRPVTAGYFETVDLPLRTGRLFAGDDRREAPRVVIVNEAFARTLQHGVRPLGTRLKSGTFDFEGVIVGVVADVAPGGESDRPAVYVSAEQVYVGGGGWLLVRLERSSAAIVPGLVSQLRAAEPALAYDRVEDVAGMIDAGAAVTRFNLRLTLGFAFLAVLLAAVGIYGLTAGEAVSRRQEMALRLALGATRVEAVWVIMRSTVAALTGGALAGLLLAFLAARGMRSLLHGTEPLDPVVLGSAATLLILIGLAASVLAATPALRAQPGSILRSE